MSNIKINFDKVGKACKQFGEEWEKMMRESNPFDTISKITKDIVDRQDKEIALEFTRCICELLKNNGVAIQGEKSTFQKEITENSIEYKYGVAITGLDFTEHDKKFKDEITQLKHDLEEISSYYCEYKNQAQDMIVKLTSELEEWKDEARAVKKNRDEMLANFRKGIEPYVDLVHMHEKIAELENRHQQDCITINQLQTTIEVIIGRYAKLKEMNNY